GGAFTHCVCGDYGRVCAALDAVRPGLGLLDWCGTDCERVGTFAQRVATSRGVGGGGTDRVVHVTRVGTCDHCSTKGAPAVDGVFCFVDYWGGGGGCSTKRGGEENFSSKDKAEDGGEDTTAKKKKKIVRSR